MRITKSAEEPVSNFRYQLLFTKRPRYTTRQAAASSLVVFRRLANSLQRDSAAVKASVTLPWSTSPVKGHINRLKMLKRHMFGRAHLDLLSRRFVRAPRHRHAEAQRVPQSSASQPAAAAA
jgi:hypothetical protein